MEYSGSRYEGPTSSGRPEGQGTYIFPNGTRYVGGFKNGVFEGKGTMYTPGGGSYAATWSEGRQVSGSYTFSDGLEYKEADWTYCTLGDRRFKTEITDGIRPAGQSQLTNARDGDPRLEEGQADAGDGYVSLRNGDGQVRDFKTGEPLRYVEAGEKKWLAEKCRVGPSGTVGRDVGTALESLFVKADMDGSGALSRGELVDLLKEADFAVLGADPAFADPAEVLAGLEAGNAEDMLSLDAWLQLFQKD